MDSRLPLDSPQPTDLLRLLDSLPPVESHSKAEGSASTEERLGEKLVAEVLRSAARITVARDALLAGYGVTGPRLRLMKAIRRLPVPFTVSQLSRAMGLSRQAVRGVVKELAATGFVALEQNCYHRKAPVVVLTEFGMSQLDKLVHLERRWLADVTRGFDEHILNQTAWVVRGLRDRLGSPDRPPGSRYIRRDFASW